MPNQPVFAPLLSGFGLGASLIVAIGSQNAFVLRQGLKREYVFAVCTVCFLCDAVLIGLGAGGFGTLVAASPNLMGLTLWGGAAFLFAYGLRSFHAALRPGGMEAADDGRPFDGRSRIILTTLALSLLNPHVYLDTVLLLGSLAGQFSGHSRALFTVGAMAASLVWFYGIGYGARVLAPLFRRPAAWRALDLLVGCTMWGIAANLVWMR
ncbi:LysE/ArgO family amino acid transporter [Geobacter pickeringii]|uniref:Amino acid transporter n=1 Tax=Geobacter pickeringii TaxID=345632 RepID=A0A0B5BF18_9BACT|nr:LysE/ArgO family amino acid transporter [Geobacter pickeringii]AJE02666.1 amino acid transporter [Geobacter pickeringii]